MSTALFVKANDRPADQAVSVQMYETSLSTYKEANPTDTVIELDLYKENLPYYGNDAITGMYKQNKGYELTPEEATIVNNVNHYLNQFLTADKVVFAFPMWNFTAPAPLTNYLAYIAQAGKVFKYTEAGPVGLAGDKKVLLLSARGGVYSVAPMSHVESAVKPLKAALGLFGIETEEVIIEGHNQFKDRAVDIIAEGLQQTAKVVASF